MAAESPVTFDDQVRELLDGKAFATVATIQPDGSPQTSVVWIERDGDAVQFSATSGRRKVRNLTRDPRVSISAYLPDNPYLSVEIRGRAEISDDPNKALPARLSRKYLDRDARDEPAEIRRVMVRVQPTKVIKFAA